MDGDFGGVGDDGGLGMGDYGGGIGDAGFGGPAPGNMGEGDFGGLGLGFGFGNADFGLDSVLSSMPNITDLSNPSLEGMEGLTSMADALGSVPGFSMSSTSSWQDMAKSKTFQAFLSLLASKNPALQGLVSTPAKAAISNNPASVIGKSAVNFGLAAANPAFAALNSIFGFTDSFTDALGKTNAISSADSQQGINEGNSGMMGALPGLAGMYAGYQGMRDSGKMLGGLQSLYSQDSPYAQAMRQQLQRKDAAGGRRSQYGPREVELQAKLAQMASGQIGQMSQLQQRQNINRAQMMQQGLGAFQKMGGLKGLASLFGMGGGGGMYDTAATQSLSSMPNFFGMDGMNSFGQLPPDLGFDFTPPWGG